MKKQLSLVALTINFIIALVAMMVISSFIEINPLYGALGIVAVHTAVSYFTPIVEKGVLQEGLLTEVWISHLAENPVPDHSFITQSQDLSMFVENNKLHLAEAGVEPSVHEDYFRTNSNELPVQSIEDIPHEAVLKIYSTNRTMHNSLLEAELSYDKRAQKLQV